MVVDTACAKQCAGSEWTQIHERRLADSGLQMIRQQSQERLRLGISRTLSSSKCLFPAGIAGAPIVLKCSEIDADPTLLLLASAGTLKFSEPSSIAAADKSTSPRSGSTKYRYGSHVRAISHVVPRPVHLQGFPGTRTRGTSTSSVTPSCRPKSPICQVLSARRRLAFRRHSVARDVPERSGQSRIP